MLAEMLLVKVASWAPGVIMSNVMLWFSEMRGVQLVLDLAIWRVKVRICMSGLASGSASLFERVALHWRADNRVIWHRSCKDVTVCRRPHVKLCQSDSFASCKTATAVCQQALVNCEDGHLVALQ